MINEDFQFLLTEFGQPSDPVFVSDSVLATYQGKLPDSLLEFWRTAGLGAWGDGSFRFCRPEDYAGVLAGVLGNDPQLKPENCLVFGYEAFCQLHVWHASLGKIKIDLVFGSVEAHFTANETVLETRRILGPDRVVATGLFDIVKDSDMKDENGKPMFARATQAHGKLQPGECFGFVPALGLGGAREVKYLRRVRALEHFSIISGLNSFNLIGFENLEERVLRPIGG